MDQEREYGLRAEQAAAVSAVAKCDSILFPGAGQHPTPVADARGLLEIITLLPGKRAQEFRRTACDVLVRYLAGDHTLHAELDDNAERQESLPSDHPKRPPHANDD